MWYEALGKEAGDHKKKNCIVVYKEKMAELQLKGHSNSGISCIMGPWFYDHNI